MKPFLFSLLVIAGLRIQAAPGSIEGTVRLLGSSSLLPNITISASSNSGAGGLRTTTDASGRFSFRSVPPGTYFVYAEAPGYSRPLKGGYSRSVVLSGGNAIPDVDLTLARAGSLKGRVYHRDGTPVGLESVVASPTTYYGGQAVLGASTSLRSYMAQTNSQGEYEIPSVDPAEYYIRAGGSKGTYFPNAILPSNGKPVVVTNGTQVVADIEWQDIAAFRISGRILDELPADIPHGLTALYLVNRDTRVRDDFPPDGIFSPSRFSTIPPQPDTNRPGVFLNGRDFEIRDIRPGSYDLFAIMSTIVGQGSLSPYRSYMGRMLIEVGDRNVENAAVTVRRGVTITGNAQFRLFPIGTTPAVPAITSPLMMSTEVQAQQFSMTNVPPGIYGIAIDDTLGFHVSDVLQAGKSIYHSGLVVGNSTPEPLEFIISRAAGSVRGVVQSADPHAAQYAWVTVAPTVEYRENRNLYNTVRADAAGRFTITGITSGEYKLFVFDEIPYFASANPGFLARYESYGTLITIKDAETLTINPVVAPFP